MRGADALLEALRDRGVEVVFGYPGGAIMPLYDALHGSGIRHVLMRHEQAAAFAADGYGRVTGRPGVCIATSGPGATNLVTGIANAFLDSVPLVAITGQVATPLMGTDAFQEVDIFGITLPIVKHSYIVRHVEELPRIVHEAWDVAAGGRPGPVLIDLPKNIAAGAAHGAARVQGPRPSPAKADEAMLARAAGMIARAERPVVYAGGGIGIGRAVHAFRRFVADSGIPVVSTLKGLGAVPTDEPLFLGMMGMHGTRAANTAVQQADLLIAVGARFDDRATGKLDGFAPGAQVIHLDVDPAEIDKLRRAEVALAGDLAASLAAIVGRPRIVGWRRHCLRLKAQHAFRYDAPGDGIYAPELLRRLSVASDGEATLTCDVGQHQMWVAQHCLIRRPERHLSSGGLGAMGYGLPAAIGAQLADPARTAIAVSGDGSIMINIQELATLRRYNLPVRILLIDNQSLGMVRQWQELFFERRFSEVDLSDNPDFAAVARSFGIDAMTIDSAGQIDAAVDALLHHPGPLFVHCRIDPAANVWPLVPPGHTNATMLEGNMQ
ncbi:MAG TPA: acetolactate synthase 2 catalytic subunit [Steroidobacteraceae bacterium]|nr:acetolactate synthase 2 catalytic subunit [Steroidobacteraceae bacterium]